MGSQRARSATSRVFLVLILVVVSASLALAGILVWDNQRDGYDEAERVTRALAAGLSMSEQVRGELADPTAAPGARSELQAYAEQTREAAEVSYITIMTPEGRRLTHRNPEEIGRPYLGTIPAVAEVLTEESTGTLGRSVRTIAPVLDAGGDRLLGWVSVGVTVDTIGASLLGELPLILITSSIFALLGFGGALLGRRFTRGVAGDLPVSSVREAVGAYESIRVLGDALRAQTHEHGNRMHTAVALLELDRVDEAIRLLTDTSQQSQLLVDQVTTPTLVDPTVSALILGKSAQAKERGIRLEIDLDPDAPRSSLGPAEMVAALGNLIDNAIDGAAAGPDPRVVRVTIAPAGDRLRIAVTDSGPGFAAGARGRIFDAGFTTKPSGATGRGMGLALARRAVEDAGGGIEVHEHPTRFVISLPRRAGERR